MKKKRKPIKKRLKRSHRKTLEATVQRLWQEGAYEKVVECLQGVGEKSEHDVLLYYKGVSLQKQGKYDEALPLIQRANQLEPKKIEYLLAAAKWFHEQDMSIPAVRLYLQIAELRPNNPAVYTQMGILLQRMERFEQAIICFAKARELRPQESSYLVRLGLCNYCLGRLEQAAQYYEEAVALGGNTSEVWTLIAALFLSKGEKESAVQAYKKSIAVDPECYVAYPGYIKAASLTDAEIEELIVHLQRAVSREDLKAHDKRLCHFSLGELFRKQKQYGSAMEHFVLGNKFRAMVIGSFVRQRVQDFLELSRESFTAPFFTRERGLSSRSKKPVFVVGMPRSGTTLLEQIVASHALGGGAGELATISTISHELKMRNDFPERLSDLEENMIEREARRYLDSLERHNRSAERIVDKMPQNFYHLWVIALLFPEAPIIYCLRDPLDTCISCFFTDFNEGHNYKESLYSLGRYYSLHRKFMAHWRTAVPNPILTVRYEELIENQEQITRKVIEHIGLEWDPNCLAFRDRGHFTQTASNLQIRKGIYNTSVGRWKKYDKYLDPLKEGLQDEDALL